MREYDLLIDGKPVPAAAGTYATTNPATGEPVSLVPRGTAREARRAIDAARRAGDAGVWSEISPAERSSRLLTLADDLWERQTELADLDTAEAGIPVRISSALVSEAIEAFRTIVERAGDTPDEDGDPYGVVSLTPASDAPFARATLALAPALAGGNTVVLNAPAFAPASILEAARAIAESDLPPGVVNVVCGTAAGAHEELAANPLIDYVFYCGPIGVARRISETAAPSLKPAAVHTGAPVTSIVLPDADLDLAVPGVLFGAMFLSGQTLRPLSRVLVPSAIVEPVVHHLRRGATAMRTGDPSSFATEIGPLATAEAAAVAEAAVSRASGEGATIACGGRRVYGLRSQAFLAPAILHNVSRGMHIAHQQLQAPVLSVLAYDSVEDAVAVANEDAAAHAAVVWGRDPAGTRRVTKSLRAARIWINDYDPLGGVLVPETSRRRMATGARSRARQSLIGLDRIFGFEAGPQG